MPGVPFNLIKALMEQGAKRLTLVGNTTGGAQQPRMPDIGMLVENGQVAKVICAFTAATRPTDVLPFTKYYESGEVEAELVPQGTLGRTDAGRRAPAFRRSTRPRRSGPNWPKVGKHGSSTAANTCWNMPCRWISRSFAPANRTPSVISASIGPSATSIPVMATAARCTIVEVDEPILPAGAIDPDDVHTPGIFVNRLVQVPPEPEGCGPPSGRSAGR